MSRRLATTNETDRTKPRWQVWKSDQVSPWPMTTIVLPNHGPRRRQLSRFMAMPNPRGHGPAGYRSSRASIASCFRTCRVSAAPRLRRPITGGSLRLPAILAASSMQQRSSAATSWARNMAARSSRNSQSIIPTGCCHFRCSAHRCAAAAAAMLTKSANLASAVGRKRRSAHVSAAMLPTPRSPGGPTN